MPLFSFGQSEFWHPLDSQDTYGNPINTFVPSYSFSYLHKKDTMSHALGISAYAHMPGIDFGIAFAVKNEQLNRDFWGRRYNLGTQINLGFLYYPHREERSLQIASAVSAGYASYFTKDPHGISDTLGAIEHSNRMGSWVSDTATLQFLNLRVFESLTYRQTVFLSYTHDFFIERGMFHQWVQVDALIRHHGLKGGLRYDSYLGAGPMLRYRINFYKKSMGVEISFVNLFDEVGPPSLLQVSLAISIR